MDSTSTPHISVMLKEVLDHLEIKDNCLYIDCTFGAGGYSKKILNKADCNLIALDQDSNVECYANDIMTQYPERFTFINDNFANLKNVALKNNINSVDGIVYDLGVSSMQIDQAERGFSFNKLARLDMRMSNKGIDAWEVVNKFSEGDLADIIFYYGEETYARKIAKQIVIARKLKTIDTTIELAQIVHYCIKKRGKIDSATKTFQAIRIFVNDELKNLKKSLYEAYNLLKVNGKIVLVSFQGLEDRIIKDFIRNLPNARAKAIKPSIEETKNNIRARSAKLRTIVKLSADPIIERVS